MKKIINKIELERELQDISISNLCKYADISRQSYYNIRSGKHDVGILKLEKLCKKLNMRIVIENNNNRK